MIADLELPGSTPIRWRRRHTLFLMPLALAVILALSAFIWSAPTTAVRSGLNPVMKWYMVPYLDQKWTLFAPTPPTYNTEAWLQVRYRQNGVTRTSATYDLTAMFDQNEGRVVPFVVSNHTRELARGEISLSQALAAKLPHTYQEGPDSAYGLNGATVPQAKGTNLSTDLFESVGSRSADVLHLPGPPQQIRVFLTDTAIQTRPDHTAQPPVTQGGDTGWLPYVPAGVR